MKKISIATCVLLVCILILGCAGSGKKRASNATSGKMSARYWDGKKFDILISHWGEPTLYKDINGVQTAEFHAGTDCLATFVLDENGIILSHSFVGACSFDMYNRLRDIHPAGSESATPAETDDGTMAP